MTEEEYVIGSVIDSPVSAQEAGIETGHSLVRRTESKVAGVSTPEG